MLTSLNMTLYNTSKFQNPYLSTLHLPYISGQKRAEPPKNMN